MGFFDWITFGVRSAVLRGVEQAAEQINEAGENGEAEVVLRLPARRLEIEHEKESAPKRGRPRKATAK